MINPSEPITEQAAAFQKIWIESMSKVMQAAFTVSPNSAPPEVLKQMRSGIFQALAASWDEFLRSPQFLEGMKQWMESAINFRKLSNDFLSRARNEIQAPSRNDIDTVLLAVRHLETRVLARLEELSLRIPTPAKNGPAKAQAKRPARRRAAGDSSSPLRKGRGPG